MNQSQIVEFFFFNDHKEYFGCLALLNFWLSLTPARPAPVVPVFEDRQIMQRLLTFYICDAIICYKSSTEYDIYSISCS